MISKATPSFTKETQDLMKILMEESKLTLFQQRQIKGVMREGKSLPQTVNPTSSKAELVSQTKKINTKSCKYSCKRSKAIIEQISNTNLDSDSSLIPRPTKPGRDVMKEKRKLQNLMAFGKELSEDNLLSQLKSSVEVEEEKVDRIDELLNEIAEREEFLNDMKPLGKIEEGIENKILTEISQRVREIKLIKQSNLAQ